MSFLELCQVQVTLFLMILIGTLLKKKGIIDNNGERCLTDLVIGIIIPCNIIKSCLMKFNLSIFNTCKAVFLSAIAIQIVYFIFNKFLYNGFSAKRKKVLQYSTIVPNGGLLGNAIAESIYGPLGLLYASFYLIPVRIVMWSSGTSYFLADSSIDKKKVLRNVLSHPCLVSVYIGMFLMLTQIQLPTALKNAITYIGNCNAPISMIIVGTIFADVDFMSIFDKDCLKFSVLRLGLLPLIAYGISLLLHLDTTGTGVAVAMAGMPAGSTAAIFAARYNSDAPFAIKVVILTTLLSMLTVPIWCYFVS